MKTIVNLLNNVAKDQNIRYVLTLFDDMLSVCIYGPIIYKWTKCPCSSILALIVVRRISLVLISSIVRLIDRRELHGDGSLVYSRDRITSSSIRYTYIIESTSLHYAKN